MNYESWKEVLKDIQLPTVVVDLDAFDRNIHKISEILKSNGNSQYLRIATKSIRVPELIYRILEKGDPFRGLMCYSAKEVSFLSSIGFDNFLVAYPTFQKSELNYLRSIHEEGKSISLIVDSKTGIERISKFMEGVRTPFPLVLEVDCSLRIFGGLLHLGVRRSPVRKVKEVIELLKFSKSFKNINLIGLMGYEAQVAGLGDQNPFKKLLNPVAKLVRTLSVKKTSKLRQLISEELKRSGYSVDIFNGGGTGSLTFARNEKCLTELTAGSGFLCSHLFDYYSNIKLEPACFFALQVVRFSDKGYVTCQGGGYIASGEAGWDKVPLPWLPKGLSLVPTEGSVTNEDW